MLNFRLVPEHTEVPFLRFRRAAFILSGILLVLSVVLLPTRGLNLGIDFRGGTLVEVRMPGAVDLGAMRAAHLGQPVAEPPAAGRQHARPVGQRAAHRFRYPVF